jgi:predicted nucleotide-binding protein
MVRKTTQQTFPSPLRLRVPAGEARQRIAERIEKGKELLKLQITSPEKLEQARNDYHKWSDYNTELLKQLFSNESIANEYSSGIAFAVSGETSFYEELKEFLSDVKEKIHRLESISERLELIPLAENIRINVDRPATPAAFSTSKVFIVHGHDEAAREMAARFLERLGLVPIILHEQASEGRTTIEKLENYSDVGFAVVLLTPDDEGRKKVEGEVHRDRARQNVLLELGYFTGKLGRNHVCALHRGSVEIPTDYLGVLYVPLDDGGGWQLRLAKELKATGFEIDMNKAI